MYWGLAGIILSSVVLAVLALNLVLNSNWPWLVKLPGVALVGVFYWITAHSIGPLMGWATTYALPERFNLLAVQVHEPDKATSSKGSIYLWVTDLQHGRGQYLPRAYVLPFTPELHVKVTDAATKLRKNLPQLGEVEPTPAGETEYGIKAPNISFYDMPDPLFPER
ncbi:MAG TPA: hypothetical protein VMH34_03125 [Gammaproteobacteria bacterium]|nr:hypothetical protein [Gammaproteobacteria bacterium]